MTMRVVNATTTFSWDNGQVTVYAGQIVDVEPGGSLEAAIGAGNLGALAGPALVSAQTGSGVTATSNS